MANPQPGAVAVYSHMLDPREHPDYARRAVKPPAWETFGNRTQFTCLRDFAIEDGRMTDIAGELERWTRKHGLGDVVWPSYPVLFASNLGELADEIAKRGLYLFDIWGYVPGSGPGGYWRQFRVPRETLTLLEEKLGERWLGTDFGEQDGRYIHGYAGQMTPGSADRAAQYLNFQRHFERMGDDLGHRHATLVSLNFGHYFLKEGTFTLIGAETAQALPNSQIYYAFIRGAGKQYGVPWFGNASVYNRWGYKCYSSSGKDADGTDHGPTKGASLSLLKRLLYTHVLYNSMVAGFENMWLDGDRLTPVGAVQQAAQRWVKEHGQPGVMHTPVALLLDFFSGWTFPRHLYSDKVYRVWGNLPYGAGDFLTDAVLDLLYPGYQDASYFRDERGFQAPTPFGDIADCLLSDAPGWVLARYPVLVVAGELGGGAEVRDKLQRYAETGGHLVLTAGNLAKLPGGIAGCASVAETTTLAVGRGKVTIFASEFGVVPNPAAGPLKSEEERALEKPFVLEAEVRRGLAGIFQGQALFSVSGEGLSVVTCRKRAGEYTVGIANNSWRETEFVIESNCGPIESVAELAIDAEEKTAEGYLPECVMPDALGAGGTTRIAGGDVRVFAVRVREGGVREIAHVKPAPRPRGRLLTLRGAAGVREQVLRRPTFFEHFDGVVVDWRALHERERNVLEGEAGWIRRQGLRVAVDLSSGLNLYPTLRLVNNAAEDYAASRAIIRSLLEKMQALGASDLILALHRQPENNITAQETMAEFDRTLREVASEAVAAGVTLHLRVSAAGALKSTAETAEFVRRIGSPALKLAPALSRLLTECEVTQVGELAELWVCAAPDRDIAGEICGWHGKLQGMAAPERERARQLLAGAGGAALVLDAVMEDGEAEYLEACALGGLLAPSC